MHLKMLSQVPCSSQGWWEGAGCREGAGARALPRLWACEDRICSATSGSFGWHGSRRRSSASPGRRSTAGRRRGWSGPASVRLQEWGDGVAICACSQAPALGSWGARGPYRASCQVDMPHHAAVAEGVLGEQEDSELSVGGVPGLLSKGPGPRAPHVSQRQAWPSVSLSLIPSLHSQGGPPSRGLRPGREKLKNPTA